MFSPQEFVQTQYQESTATVRIPVEAKDYAAQISKVEAREVTIGKGERVGQKAIVLDVIYNIDDAEQKTLTGRDPLAIRQSIFLDTTERGGLDFGKGKNVRLGRLREAAGQNAEGQAWSPGMLSGVMVRVQVGQRIDGEDIYEDIKKVTGI
ncbi:MAG: hypothetical protein FVQ79_00120 [Planctomycetes bacterium]|nr:hypothetical protein [Planctomycetota bacterium]